MPQSARPDVSDRSVGSLISEVTNDLSTLMRQEMDLAKAEIKEEVAKTGKAAGMLGGAGFAGYMVALFLSFALWWGLANGMDEGWAALIVAVIWGVIGRGPLRDRPQEDALRCTPSRSAPCPRSRKFPTPSRAAERTT